MTAAEIEAFRKMAAQLEGVSQELATANKKSADKPVTAFKVRHINTVLNEVATVLGDSAPAIEFDGFDEGDLPTNSDVSFIVAQFVECAEKVRSENVGKRAGVWYWRVNGVLSDLATNPPKGVR